jgi:hypothetical protein
MLDFAVLPSLKCRSLRRTFPAHLRVLHWETAPNGSVSLANDVPPSRSGKRLRLPLQPAQPVTGNALFQECEHSAAHAPVAPEDQCAMGHPSTAVVCRHEVRNCAYRSGLNPITRSRP